MKYFAVAAALAASAAATTVGDGVPLIYAATPYPNPPYDGTQYNATVINGVPYNNSNEWPCLTAEKYFTIPPACAKDCLIGTFKNATICENDDFTCHCDAAGSAELDEYIIPCLTAADSPCTGEEIGELANFVHGALCPYFMATTHDEAYGHCDGSWSATTTSSSSTKGYGWATTTSKATTSTKGYGWATTTSSSSSEKCSTSTQTSWTKECEGPTTFWVGTKTWEITSATTLTVTDCPITWTSPVTASGSWAPVSWTTAAPVTAASATASWTYTTPAGGYAAAGTGSWASSSTPYAAQFTGAASNNKVAGAVAVVAAGAALLI